jgi:hypothetical protein
MSRLGTGRIAAAAVALGLLAAGQASAGEAELQMLGSLIGSWKGYGTLIEPGKESPFECKLTVGKGNRGKVVLNVKCPLIEANGGIAFNEAAAQFEIALTSTADFRAAAYGTVENDKIVFPVRAKDTDKKNNAVSIVGQLSMHPDAVIATFEATLNGNPYSGKMTFSR